MKFALVLLVVLPLAFATQEKRFLLDDLSHLLNFGELKNNIQTLANRIGSDATEKACENDCPNVLTAHIVTDACPIICKSFQSLVKHFNIAPKQ